MCPILCDFTENQYYEVIFRVSAKIYKPYYGKLQNITKTLSIPEKQEVGHIINFAPTF
jgi:hypothetical protein